MKSKILKYLSKYTEITEQLENAINESAYFTSYKKGDILLKEGDFSNECYFILEGCIRSYFVKDGEEKTIEFYTEEEVVTPSNIGKSMPSQYFLECLEDTVVNVGNPALENEMYHKYPQLESLSRVIAEVILTKQQESYTAFKSSTPEERYLQLLKTRPNLLQRASQHQIASYLGIRSRIRKRLINK